MELPKKKYYYKDYQVKYKRENYKRVFFLLKRNEDKELINALEEKNKSKTRNAFIVNAVRKAVLEENEKQG